MGPTGGTQKEFWWEREWRRAGSDLDFTLKDVVTVLAPHWDHGYLRQHLSEYSETFEISEDYYLNLRFVDPTWGLERIIARLAGVPDSEAGPYPIYPGLEPDE